MELSINDVILLQTGLEIFLVFLLAALLWRTWKRPPSGPGESVPEDLKAAIERFVAESESISVAFSRNLEAKRALSAELVQKLDARLELYREVLSRTEAAVEESLDRLEKIEREGRMAPPSASAAADQKANPAAPEVRALVLKLRKEGLKVEDIAVRSRLHRGEVELILEVERGFDV
ncbi:MAG: hypothetical protein LBQ12_11530 [Deltaproteobacteria bacterium]|nr:hypothetical protein [Deltaproteobacteria bacterium]